MTHVIYTRDKFLELKFVKIDLNLNDVCHEIKKVFNKKTKDLENSK